MRVFISFAQGDAELAAQLAASLRRHDIEAWSRLDFASDDRWHSEWHAFVDREGGTVDGFIFLMGPAYFVDDELRAEWRWFLRHNWDGTKPLLPVIARDSAPSNY